MDIPGYAGSILHVDLTSGRTRKELLDPELVMTLIGGYGINNKLAYELIPQGVAPLSPENLIIIGAGPFADTLVPGAAKVLVTTRFPINRDFATAAGGGSFALMLKSVGYDHLVISGRAQRPVFLKITEGNVEFCQPVDDKSLNPVLGKPTALASLGTSLKSAAASVVGKLSRLAAYPIIGEPHLAQCSKELNFETNKAFHSSLENVS